MKNYIKKYICEEKQENTIITSYKSFFLNQMIDQDERLNGDNKISGIRFFQ